MASSQRLRQRLLLRRGCTLRKGQKVLPEHWLQVFPPSPLPRLDLPCANQCPQRKGRPFNPLHTVCLTAMMPFLSHPWRNQSTCPWACRLFPVTHQPSQWILTTANTLSSQPVVSGALHVAVGTRCTVPGGSTIQHLAMGAHFQIPL